MYHKWVKRLVGPGLRRAGQWLGGELDKRGHTDAATTVRKWGDLAAGSAWLVAQLSDTPGPEELRQICQVLGDELELLEDPTAALFRELAQKPELDGAELFEKCGAAMEDSTGLRSADLIAVVWRAFKPAEPAESEAG